MKHRDYIGVIFAVGLAGGLILKAANEFFRNDRLEVVANVLMAAPLVLLACMIPVVLVVNYCIDRRLRGKRKKHPHDN